MLKIPNSQFHRTIKNCVKKEILLVNFISINKYLRWCRALDFFGSQFPMTTGEFELQISCMPSSYLTH